jgi:hypothetical protein
LSFAYNYFYNIWEVRVILLNHDLVSRLKASKIYSSLSCNSCTKSFREVSNNKSRLRTVVKGKFSKLLCNLLKRSC